MIDVDVIVLDLDGGSLLDDCLASIAAQTLAPKRVIVFDSAVHRGIESKIVKEVTSFDFVVDPFKVATQHTAGAEGKMAHV